MPDPTFLGVDVGSSAVKALAVDTTGTQLGATTRAAYPVHRPAPDRWEIDLTELTGAVAAAVRALPEPVRAAAGGLALTGQMCGLISLDADRRPLGRCIPIFDGRATAQAAALDRRFGDRLLHHQGNRALPIYTLPKLLWLREHEPARLDRTDLVVLPKDYVRGWLTGTWVTEPSDASGTGAFDQSTGGWDTALLAELGLPASLWPPVVASDAPAGTVGETAAAATGLTPGLPVYAGAADMAAVPVGVGAEGPDGVILSFGTAAHVISPVTALSPDAWPAQQFTQAAPDAWFRFGAVYSGGSALEWLLGVTGSGGDYQHFEDLPPRAPDEHVLFMPYLSGAGAPHELPGAAGSFVGLRIGHNRSDLARAVLEGVVFEIAGIRDHHDPHRTRRVHVTGGATRLHTLVRTLTDVLDQEVWVSREPDAAAVGAALLARRGAAGGTPSGTPSGTSDGILDTPAAGPDAGATAVRPDPDGVAHYRAVRARYERAAAAIRGLA